MSSGDSGNQNSSICSGRILLDLVDHKHFSFLLVDFRIMWYKSKDKVLFIKLKIIRKAFTLYEFYIVRQYPLSLISN